VIYIKKYDLIFIHLTKTGGESALSALGSNQKRHNPVSAIIDVNFREKYAKQLKFYEVLSNYNWERYLERILNNWNKPKITFVRNPWDRLVSEFSYNKNKNIEPREFDEVIYSLLQCTEDIWKWSQYKWLVHEGKNYADKVYKLETDIMEFEEDFNVEYPHLNQSSREPYQNYYNERTKKVVELIFADDIKEFGYEF